MCSEVLKNSEVGCSAVKDYCSELKYYRIIYGWTVTVMFVSFCNFVWVCYFCSILYTCIILLLCFSFCNFCNLLYVINMDYYSDRGFPCFPSVVSRMLGYSSQRRGTVRTLTSTQWRVNGLLYVLLVLTVGVICNFGQ